MTVGVSLSHETVKVYLGVIVMEIGNIKITRRIE